MSETLLPDNLLQKLEEKVTLLLLHLDEAHSRQERLERDIAALKQEINELKYERDHHTGKLKTIIDLLDETVRTTEAAQVSTPAVLKEVEFA